MDSLSGWQEDVTVDQKQPPTKKERRQRRKRLERARRRRNESARAKPSPVDLDQTGDSQQQDAQKQTPKKGRGHAKRPDVTEADIQGLKYFDKLGPLLGRLHDVGCERDRAGNRDLHFDQYCQLILLYLFNPIVTSLRGIQQASELQKVQRKLGCPRVALGSLSEAATVFDPERLKEIIDELGAELKPLGRDARLKDLDQTLTLVDGTVLAALPKLIEASWRKETTGSGLVNGKGVRTI